MVRRSTGVVFGPIAAQERFDVLAGVAGGAAWKTPRPGSSRRANGPGRIIRGCHTAAAPHFVPPRTSRAVNRRHVHTSGTNILAYEGVARDARSDTPILQRRWQQQLLVGFVGKVGFDHQRLPATGLGSSYPQSQAVPHFKDFAPLVSFGRWLIVGD